MNKFDKLTFADGTKIFLANEKTAALWHKTDCSCEHCAEFRKVFDFTPKEITEDPFQALAEKIDYIRYQAALRRLPAVAEFIAYQSYQLGLDADKYDGTVKGDKVVRINGVEYERFTGRETESDRIMQAVREMSR